MATHSGASRYCDAAAGYRRQRRAIGIHVRARDDEIPGGCGAFLK